MAKLRKAQQKYSKLVTSLSVCVIVSSLSACSLLPKEEQVLAPPLVEPAKVEYDVVDVKTGTIIKSLKGAGSLTPVENHNLSFSESGGRIKKFHVSEGNVVKKGQLLVEVDTANLSFDIKQAEIDLKKAELQLKGLQSQKADQLTIDIAKLDVQSVKNKVQYMKEQLAKSQLKSPINGIVTFVGEQKAGDPVQAFESIVQVANTSNLQVLYTAQSVEQIADIKLGMTANLTSNGKAITGKVVQTPKDVPLDIMETNAELYQKSILISLAELPKDAKVGDLIDFEVISQQKEKVLVIPKNGLRLAMGRNYVQILDGNTKREVDIEVGISTDTEVEVIKGLSEGDKVILK